MSPKRGRRPNVPPFPSAQSGPSAFSRDRPSQLVSRENAQAQLLHQAIEGALDLFRLENISGGTLRLDTIILGDKVDPATDDFRWKLDVGTNNQLTVSAEEYDESEEDWFQSGEQMIVNGSEVVRRFNEYLGGGGVTAHGSHRYNQHEFTWENAFAFSDTEATARALSAAFTDGDTTPDISGRVMWRTANTSPTTITAFDHSQNADDRKHLAILRIGDANTTIDLSSASLEGNDDGSYACRQGDVFLLMREGGTSPVTTVLLSYNQADVEALIDARGLEEQNSGGPVSDGTISHGLSGTPDAVQFSAADSTAASEVGAGSTFVDNFTATTFDLTNGSGSGTYYWTAVRNV